AVILAPEVTPIKGLDLKPMFSYFINEGRTNGSSRVGRGGINATTWFQNTCTPTSVANPNSPAWQNGPACAGNNANGTWRKGLDENRFTMGLDGRLRMGPFSLGP